MHSRWAPQLSAVAATVAHASHQSVPPSCITMCFSYWNFTRAGLKLHGLDDPVFDSPRGKIIFSLSKLPDRLWQLRGTENYFSPCRRGSVFVTQSCIHGMYVCMNRPGLEADYLPPSSADLSVGGATFLFIPQDTFTLTFSTAFTNRTVF